MKIKVTLEVDIDFDLESDGVLHGEDVVDKHVVGKAVTSVLHTDIVVDSMVDAITDDTGWCVLGIGVNTEAEQVG